MHLRVSEEIKNGGNFSMEVNSGFGFVFRSHNNSVSFATAPQIKYSVCIFPF